MFDGRVKIAENMRKNEIGMYYWGGALNTVFEIDPVNQISILVLTLFCPKSNFMYPIDLRFTDLLYVLPFPFLNYDIV